MLFPTESPLESRNAQRSQLLLIPQVSQLGQFLSLQFPVSHLWFFCHRAAWLCSRLWRSHLPTATPPCHGSQAPGP